MKEIDFEKQARYEYYICKYVDDRGELIHIRFVEQGSTTHDLLRANGYVKCFSGPRADGFILPNYRKVLVMKETSSTGEQGTIVATRQKEVFDKDGNSLGMIWDTKHCGVGGLDFHLIEPSCGWLWMFLKEVYLEEKYVEVFERIKEEKRKSGYSIQITYEDLWAKVDHANE